MVNGNACICLSRREVPAFDVQAELLDRVRAHYDDPKNIADDIEELGFPGAANILRERLPRDAKKRSGEIGKILASRP